MCHLSWKAGTASHEGYPVLWASLNLLLLACLPEKHVCQRKVIPRNIYGKVYGLLSITC